MPTPLPSTPYWQPALGTLDAFVEGLDELAQAIRIIITTPKGSVPLRPAFGCDLRTFMDLPQGLARVRLIREVTAAVEAFEPRVKVSRVEVTGVGFGASALVVHWSPRGTTEAPIQTEVLLSPIEPAPPSAQVPPTSYAVSGGVVDGGDL